MSAVIAHRCRFAEYVPKAIIAIAFSADGNRMALARYDGDIELWNHGNAEWFAERVRPLPSSILSHHLQLKILRFRDFCRAFHF
jgi:hypothetical protein